MPNVKLKNYSIGIVQLLIIYRISVVPLFGILKYYQDLQKPNAKDPYIYDKEIGM